MTIQRYSPTLAGGRNKRAVMTTDTHGVYVTHASHQAEIDRLKRELDALKDGLKRQIFAPLEKAMMNALIKTVMQATQEVYTVNPCHKLTAERVREIMGSQIREGVISLAESEEHGFATGGFVKQSEPGVRVGEMHLGGGVFSMSSGVDPAMTSEEDGFATRYVMAIPIPEQRDSWSLLCVKSNCKYFTAGKRYDYEIRADEMVIVQDDFVSDLASGDDYELTDEGAYWMMTDSHSKGESVAIFKKNK